MVFPERFEPGNPTESTKQKYISKCDGLKPIQDLTMMNFDDLETISDQKLFQVFSVEKNNNFFLSKIFQIFFGTCILSENLENKILLQSEHGARRQTAICRGRKFAKNEANTYDLGHTPGILFSPPWMGGKRF